MPTPAAAVPSSISQDGVESIATHAHKSFDTKFIYGTLALINNPYIWELLISSFGPWKIDVSPFLHAVLFFENFARIF